MHQFRIAVRYLQKEFPVVLDDFFQVLYAGGDSCSQQLAQGCRGMLQPMFESPHIPLNLKAQSERISRIKNIECQTWFQFLLRQSGQEEAGLPGASGGSSDPRTTSE